MVSTGGGGGSKVIWQHGRDFHYEPIGFRVKMSLFELDFRNVLCPKFIGYSNRLKAEAFLFRFSGQNVKPIQLCPSYHATGGGGGQKMPTPPVFRR